MKQYCWDILELEDILDVTINKNMLCLGLDTAQKRTGICLLRTDENNVYLESFHLVDIKGAGKGSVHKKVIKYYGKMLEIKKLIKAEGYKEKKRKIVIEDCFLSFSVWTTKILARYETVALLALLDWSNLQPDPIMPNSARKKCKLNLDKGESCFRLVEGKRKKVWIRKPLDTKDQVKLFISDTFDLNVEEDNEADSFLLALSGLIKGN